MKRKRRKEKMRMKMKMMEKKTLRKNLAMMIIIRFLKNIYSMLWVLCWSTTNTKAKLYS